MSVMAASVKTTAAQKQARGVSLSRSQRKSGIMTIRPIVSRFGRLSASSAREVRRSVPSGEAGTKGGAWPAIGSALLGGHEEGSVAGEAEETPLPAGRLRDRQRARDEPSDPAHEVVAPEDGPVARRVERSHR